MHHRDSICTCFFFNDTATTEIYTLSLHDALPISYGVDESHRVMIPARWRPKDPKVVFTAILWPIEAEEYLLVLPPERDRKSTRLNSSHLVISYAVFCLKKKNNTSSSSFHHPATPS